jgi:hypothetical protein
MQNITESQIDDDLPMSILIAILNHLCRRGLLAMTGSLTTH